MTKNVMRDELDGPDSRLFVGKITASGTWPRDHSIVFAQGVTKNFRLNLNTDFLCNDATPPKTAQKAVSQPQIQ